ncbi:MAG: periplasmic serine protease [Rhodospirillaceae bacterium]|nr:MAG: periplasmic serine protease [Rhodospirillaceae bacterium]
MPDIPHLASRVFGTPLLIARPRLEVILSVLAPRLAGVPIPPLEPATPLRGPEMTADGIAVVPILGTLVSRSGYLGAASGLMSYDSIGDAIEDAATDPRTRGIVLDVDSGGGEVGGLFDLADRISMIRRTTGIPLWAVANEAALSAAYAVAAQADRLYVTQTGEAGSIGVVAVHVDESVADARSGFAWTFVHAGARKVDGTSHAPLSDIARSDLQADVDRMYDRFTALVADRRSLAPAMVRATEAAVYRGDRAVKVGLADRVGTLRTALADLAADLSPARSKKKEIAMEHETRAEQSAPAMPILTSGFMQPIAPVAASVAPVAASVAPVVPAPDPLIEQRLRAEYADLAALTAQAGRLGVGVDVAMAMAKGVSVDALRRSVLEQLAARADATHVTVLAPSGESPLVTGAGISSGGVTDAHPLVAACIRLNDQRTAWRG